nr:DEAD/DEAH box helicase [Desulfobulbaceae bacterium]
MTFSALGLSDPLIRALTEKGYVSPYPIQIKVIPLALTGKDILATAQTGTGKTACFTLPILQRLSGGFKVKNNHVKSLILAPTRELAVQIAANIDSYGKYISFKSGVVYGGVKINPQMMLLRGGVDLLVATPGRLLDLYNKNAVKFAQLETLVLDEADRMLDLGFTKDINKIIDLLPLKRQNLLFSATISNEIRKLTNKLLKNPQHIDAGIRNSTASNVNQYVYEVDKAKKAGLLIHLLRNKGWGQVLVFTRTKKGADQLVQQLKAVGFSASAIHGDKSQSERTQSLAAFKEKNVQILVATDLASRGLDINELPHVINFDLPKVAEDYVHRIGRTGRAGLEGEAISLISADEVSLLTNIETLIRRLLVREVQNGFVPTHSVPVTHLLKQRPKKPKKAKKVTLDHNQADGRKTQNTRGKGTPKSSFADTKSGGKTRGRRLR